MAQEIQPIPTLFTDHDRHVVALSAYTGYYLGETSDFTLSVAAFSAEKIVLHTFKSADVYDSEPTPAVAQQVALTAQEMETLIQAYQSYRNAQQTQAAASTSVPHGDPFLPDFPD